MEDSIVFDVFQTAKSQLFLGNYEEVLQEVESTEIDSEDLSQVIRSYLYKILAYIEDQNSAQLKSLLEEMKAIKQLAGYSRIFYVFIAYSLSNQLLPLFDKTYTDLLSVPQINSVILPTVLTTSMMLIEMEEYEKFSVLIAKCKSDLEILSLQFYVMLKLNKTIYLEKVVNTMMIVDSDSTITKVCLLIYNLYMYNDFEKAVSYLNDLKQNNKITIKLCTYIGIIFMSKGQFQEAARVLQMGKTTHENKGDSPRDYNTVLVNLIACYRNMNELSEVKAIEEALRNSDPENPYFIKLKHFEDSFNEIK